MTYFPKEKRDSPALEKTERRGVGEPTPFDPRIDPRFYDRIQTGPDHPVDPDLQFDPEDIQDAEALERGFGTGDPPPSSTIPAWECVVGKTFTAAIVVPPNTFTGHLGARVEAPGTRAIVTAWSQAGLTGDMYTVTLDSPVVTGPYQLVWMTDESVSSYTSFIPLIAVDPSEDFGDSSTWPRIDPSAITPSVDEIAAMEGTRARDIDDGTPVGTFNDSTYPNGEQVEVEIANAVTDVLAVIPDIIDPDYWPRARTAVKYLASVLIEQSYFRESGPSSGAVLTYIQRFNALIGELNRTTSSNPAMRLV